MTSQCIACGMPMSKPEDHALSDLNKAYCVHCAHPDGTMVSRDEALEGLTAFMVTAQGIDEAAAREVVIELVAKLPAWATD